MVLIKDYGKVPSYELFLIRMNPYHEIIRMVFVTLILSTFKYSRYLDKGYGISCNPNLIISISCQKASPLKSGEDKGSFSLISEKN